MTSVALTEMTPEGARLQVKAAIDAGADRQAHEAELREKTQGALRDAGLLRSA